METSGRRRFEVVGASFTLQLSDEDSLLYVDRFRNGGWHESAITDRYAEACRGSACVLDVGAHIGWYSLIAAKLAPQSKVFAFEPNAENAAALNKNLDLGGVGNVTVLSVAVSEDHRKREMLLAGPSSLESRLVKGGHGVPVDTVSIDGWCAEHGVDPDLIKIDVEGHEEEVLRGMRLTLVRCAPMLFVEVHSPTLMSRCVCWLKGNGYAVDAVRLGENIGGWCNTVLHATPPHARNEGTS